MSAQKHPRGDGSAYIYSVKQLAQLSGVSPRTLRYYDQIGLLHPQRQDGNDYRRYGRREVDRLQQILLYRELGVPLEQVGHIVGSASFDQTKALKEHLSALYQRKEQVNLLIENVGKTIDRLEGRTTMSDKEKFEGFKKRKLEDNERIYGTEIRERYGNETVETSNRKFADMSQQQWETQEALSAQFAESLKAAIATDDPAGDVAQHTCDLHRQWLCLFWPDGTYSKESHRGMGEMYVNDERFKAYYDAIDPRAAAFLKQALDIYCA